MKHRDSRRDMERREVRQGGRKVRTGSLTPRVRRPGLLRAPEDPEDRDAPRRGT